MEEDGGTERSRRKKYNNKSCLGFLKRSKEGTRNKVGGEEEEKRKFGGVLLRLLW